MTIYLPLPPLPIAFVMIITCCHILSVIKPLFRCNPLSPEHPCWALSDRDFNFTLPPALPFDTACDDIAVQLSLSIIASMRGSLPDACLDVVERYICIATAPPCDPNSNGLPMLFCEQDCVLYTMLKEEGACDSTLEFIRGFTGNSKDLMYSVITLEKFDCNNITTYLFLESDGYAETCTSLLPEKSRGNIFDMQIFSP